MSTDERNVRSEDGAIVVDMDEGGFTYEWAARKRPFLHPVATPSGTVLTRNAPEDHPWHHGLWFTIKLVNDENFWEEYDAYGVLRHVEEPKISTIDGVTRWYITGELNWIRPDRETVIIVEHRSFATRRLDDTAYAIDVSTTLTPRADVVLDRTPFTTWGGYGGLAFRGRGDWTDTRLLLDDGETRDRVLGDQSRWCDLSGSVDGGDAGVAILSHATSPRHPVPWYGSTKADTYGEDGWSNFLNAAFLWDGPLSVATDESLNLRYRVVVHDGVWDAERCEQAWQDYTGKAVG